MFCGSEPEATCIEPDFTDSGFHEWDRQLTASEQAVTLHVPAEFPRPEPSNPPAKDPIAVRDDPEWPLAAYWPVYLSNFMVNDSLENHWYNAVSDFFASKCLQTRMIYFHTVDVEFMRVQRMHMLIEALVYFGTKEEADRALATCHRTLYYGHWLNVLPGRTPEYFRNDRAIRFIGKTGKSVGALSKAESLLEQTLIPFGKVEMVIRHDGGHMLVQFATVKDMLQALSSQASWKPIQLKGDVRKQRFLESDVKMGIKWTIESNEQFLSRQPRRKILQYFEDGIQPIVDNVWKTFSHPQLSKAAKQYRRASQTKIKSFIKNKRKQAAFLRYAKTDAYKNLPESEKKALHEEIGFDPTAPKPKRRGSVTLRHKRAEVMKSVNWILQTNGKQKLSREDMLERLKVRDDTLRMARESREDGV